MPTPHDGKLRPGVAGYWLAGALVITGVAGAIIWFVLGFIGLSDTIDDFQRVPADGGGIVTLDADRDYVIYIEEDNRFGSGVRVGLIDPNGAEVDIDRYRTELTYDFGGRAGRAAFTFRSGESGDYNLLADGPTDVELAVGSSVAGDLVLAITVPFVIGGVGLLLGLLLLIVTLVRRSGAKKRRDATLPPPYGAPPPGPPPPAPPHPAPPPGPPR
jgi:hypothetical protein